MNGKQSVGKKYIAHNVSHIAEGGEIEALNLI